MTFKTKYNRLEEVNIIAIATVGVVIAFYLGDHELQYQVRYPFNGEYRTVYFFDFELERRTA